MARNNIYAYYKTREENSVLRIAPTRSVTFTQTEKKQEKKYKDPLMQWPARGLAYTNELGAAISEVAPKMGTLLWFPAMLYFGADIYDKYKNKKTSYDPNAQRATEQAIFQLLASVVLPTTAVLAGQKAASVCGVMQKSGLSLQSEEEIMNFIQEFSNRRHLADFTNNVDGFKKHFTESLSTNRDKLIKEHMVKNPFVMVKDYLFARRHPESIALSQKEKVLQFADKQIDQMFEIYNDLMAGNRPKEFSDKYWKKFKKLKETFAKNPDYKETFVNDAAEAVIKKFQKKHIMKNKMLKTLGGFVALGIAIKPIDKFVENVIIKKYVEPNIGMLFADNAAKNFKDKNLK